MSWSGSVPLQSNPLNFSNSFCYTVNYHISNFISNSDISRYPLKYRSENSPLEPRTKFRYIEQIVQVHLTSIYSTPSLIRTSRSESSQVRTLHFQNKYPNNIECLLVFTYNDWVNSLDRFFHLFKVFKMELNE